MQMSASPFRSSGGSIARQPVLACLVTLILGLAGADALAQGREDVQSCGDLPEPRDRAVISSPAQVPSVYVARLNEGKAERVVELFAADGVHRGPDGQIRSGRVAIRKFYEGVLVEEPRKLAVGRSVADGHRVAFELINGLLPCNEDDPALALDLMEINADGKIQDFTMFARPRPE